jgi:hypothetical protein
MEFGNFETEDWWHSIPVTLHNTKACEENNKWKLKKLFSTTSFLCWTFLCFVKRWASFRSDSKCKALPLDTSWPFPKIKIEWEHHQQFQSHAPTYRSCYAMWKWLKQITVFSERQKLNVTVKNLTRSIPQTLHGYFSVLPRYIWWPVHNSHQPFQNCQP